MDHSALVDLRQLADKLLRNDVDSYNLYLDEMLLRLPEGTRQKLRDLDEQRLRLLGQLEEIVTRYERLEDEAERVQLAELEADHKNYDDVPF